MRRLLGCVLSLFAFVVAGCASIPQGAASVDAVSIENNHAIASGDIEEVIATTESPKLFGLFRGAIFDYSLFDESVLARDLERVERFYRTHGFYEARVRAGRVHYKSAAHVEVTIDVDEGPRTTIAHVHIDGVAGLPIRARRAVESAIGNLVATGASFEEGPFDEAPKDATRALTDRGFAWAKVEHRADVDVGAHSATLYFSITPGPDSKIGKVRIEGLKKLPEPPLRRAIDLRVGEHYSTNKLERAREAVLGLGAFSAVEVTPDLGDGPTADHTVPIVVHVHEQRVHSVVLGGGIELDALKTEAHVHAGWEHNNFFGGYQHFQVDLKPGLDLYPTRIPTFQAPTTVLPEERFTMSLRQPGFLEARTNAVITQEINTYPVLLSPEVDPRDPVIGYVEYKGAAGIERTFRKLFFSPTYDLQYNLPFAYHGRLDPALRSVLVSYVDVGGRFDLRNDRLRPHSGIYLADDIQFAGLGGDALDIRLKPEVRAYIPLGPKVTLATRATVGFLFPFNYGAASAAGATGERLDRTRWTEDLELIYLRGFFSGGPSSNRGYPLRGVGPHGVVPFLNPGLEAQALSQSCNLKRATTNAIACDVPLGGLSLWVASVELRVPIAGPFSRVVFVDASDVSPNRFSQRLDYPHLSTGHGLRLDTPIGPVRADFGYRIPGLQYPSSADPIAEGDPGTIFGLPIAFAFGLGEAF